MEALLPHKTLELRDVFTAQSVVYVYHDQIDNTGEHEEDAVFEACEKDGR